MISKYGILNIFHALVEFLEHLKMSIKKFGNKIDRRLTRFEASFTIFLDLAALAEPPLPFILFLETKFTTGALRCCKNVFRNDYF